MITHGLLMTLDEFIALPDPIVSIGQWIEVEGFDSLYVRKGHRYINGQRYSNVFDLANINAEKPRHGAFTRLLARLEQIWDGPLWVENVLDEGFGESLVRRGFQPCGDPGEGIPRCYVKHLDKGKKHESNR